MTDQGTDPLSSLAREILLAGSYDALIVQNPATGSRFLDDVTPDQLFAVPITSTSAAWATLAALWLRHDALDKCHSIVQKSPSDFARYPHGNARKTSLNVVSMQSVENDKDRDPQYLEEMTGTFAFWHAIMHRREGDFSNSKYWYRQGNGHAVSLPLAARANEVINPFPADKNVFRITASGWNPSALVDLVEQVHHRPDDPRHRLAVALQNIEWQTLFEHCTRSASGK